MSVEVQQVKGQLYWGLQCVSVEVQQVKGQLYWGLQCVC